MSTYTDHRIYAQRERLALLAKLGSTLSWRPPFFQRSLLTGKQKAQQRGRGMDFIELRYYQAGDDIRNIDWKASARTGQTYMRQYALETDKQISLIIDQTDSLFFASDGTMKSALVAELSAIVVGRAIADGDRISGSIITDVGMKHLLSGRGTKAQFVFFEQVVESNHKLPRKGDKSYQFTLLDALIQLRQKKPRGQQIFIFSDFLNIESGALKNEDLPENYCTFNSVISDLSYHNNIIGMCAYDPLERVLPDENLVLGGQDYQIAVGLEQSRIREQFETAVNEEIEALVDTFTLLNLPLIFFSTHLDCWEQILHTINSGRRYG